jgi:hypothetical protein
MITVRSPAPPVQTMLPHHAIADVAYPTRVAARGSAPPRAAHRDHIRVDLMADMIPLLVPSSFVCPLK